MKKVQFFSDVNIDSLQLQVNEWLSRHKDISIMDTDITCICTGDTHKEKFSFYILYNARGQKGQTAAVLKKEYVVPVEIKTNIEKLGN